MKPATKYTKSGRISIAYQVLGKGPIDIVYVPGWISNIDLMWENPELSNFLTRLAKVFRVILFDKRGTGLSDRVTDLSSLEDRMDDIRAVMDAVKSEKAVLFGHSEGGSVSALFAATYPKRTLALITFGVFAKRRWSENYPWAPNDKERQEVYDMIENNWGSGEMNLGSLAPSKANDKNFMDWLARYFRSGASPSAALVLTKMNTQVDIINILETIEVPTLLLYRTNDIDVKVEEGRFIANKIKSAKMVEFSGNDHLFWVGNTNEVLDEISKFLAVADPLEKYNRQLASIMYTEIVDPEKHLSKLGDMAWMNTLENHAEISDHCTKLFRGRIIQYLENGVLAVFDGPGKAVHCALEIKKQLISYDLELKIGIHIGECIFSETNITGIAVHKTKKVKELAHPGEVLITKTLKNLLYGTGLEFNQRGSFSMNESEESIELLSVKEPEINEIEVLPELIKPTIQNHSFLESVLQSIEVHINDESFGVEILCKEIGMGERHLQRKLKAIANKSPNQLIRSVRLHRAKELLISFEKSISEAAFSTGFSSTSYFTKCFKKEFGKSPSEIIKVGA